MGTYYIKAKLEGTSEDEFMVNVGSGYMVISHAMLVTGSRAAAVKYKLVLNKDVKKKDCKDIRALVTFSGKVRS